MIKLFLLVSLLGISPVQAFADTPYCAELNNAKTYKDNESYRFLVASKEGHLFRSRKDLKQDFTLSPQTIKNFSKLDKILKSQGKIIHIVMPPTRGILSADKIPLSSPHIEGFDGNSALSSFNDSLVALKNAGISVADLSSIPTSLYDNFYYKRDHHWTYQGAKYSAEKTAALLTPYAKDLPQQEFMTDTTKESMEIAGSFGQFVERVCGTNIPDETAPVIKTYAKAESEDLFGDTPLAAIALIGTSNTTEPAPSYSNFAGYLRDMMQSDIDNLSIQGAGIYTPILSYFSAENPNKKNHKHLIWELASHYDFNGKEFAPLFLQLIPAAAGRCDGKEVTEGTKGITAEKLELLTAGDKPFSGQNNYIHLQFNTPTKQDFALSIVFKDGKSARFRFEREARYPHEGVYFLDLDQYGDKEINQISILTPKDFEADSLAFQTCAYPTI